MIGLAFVGQVVVEKAVADWAAVETVVAGLIVAVLAIAALLVAPPLVSELLLAVLRVAQLGSVSSEAEMQQVLPNFPKTSSSHYQLPISEPAYVSQPFLSHHIFAAGHRAMAAPLTQ